MNLEKLPDSALEGFRFSPCNFKCVQVSAKTAFLIRWAKTQTQLDCRAVGIVILFP